MRVTCSRCDADFRVPEPPVVPHWLRLLLLLVTAPVAALYLVALSMWLYNRG